MAEVSNERTYLRLLYEGKLPKVDIVGIENISEKSLRSWTYEKEGEPSVLWLSHKKFLPYEFPKSRIFSFGYAFDDESGPRTLGESLLQELAKVRAEPEVVTWIAELTGVQKNRPIILLGLGFGGVVCMQVRERHCLVDTRIGCVHS
jgi:hypothetical protein